MTGPNRAGLRKGRRSGQATMEFALTFVSIIAPMTFGIIFVAQLLWVWHSMVEFTRDGARYATTHCWQADSANVLAYMTSNVPINIDQAQFQEGPAQIVVAYFTVDPDSGALTAFSCDSDCTTGCVPDVVQVSLTNYTYGRFFTSFLKLPGVVMPSWLTSLPMEGAGCDPAAGVCLP